MTEIGYNNLRLAVIKQACDDYLTEHRRLRLCKDDDKGREKAKGIKEEIERIEKFFSSEHFKFFCDLDGGKLCEALKEKAKEVKRNGR